MEKHKTAISQADHKKQFIAEILTFASNNPYKKLSMLSSTKEQGSGMSKLFNTWKNTQQAE